MKLRRHRNRALFDLDRQEWVKLAAVTRAVRRGEEVTVTQVGSEQDVTALVYVQLLYEEAMRGKKLDAAALRKVLEASSGSSGGHASEQLRDESLAAARGKRR